MGYFRKTTISLACFLLFWLLTFFGVALATRQVIGQPGPLESALSQTNAYNAIVTNFIQGHQDSTTIGVPLTIPAIQTAARQAFPESVVEPAVNQLISGLYAWAQGKTPTLMFRIDLSGAKTNLANDVGQAVEQQAAKLPICPNNDLVANPQQALQNPLTITCIPPKISSASVGSYARQAVLSSSFLKDPVLTPANLGLTSGNQLKLSALQQSQPQQTISLPHIYHQLMESLYISSALAVVCIGVIVWLHRDHLRGLRRAAATVGGAGVVCILEAIAAGKIPAWINDKLLNSSSQQITNIFQQTLTKVLTILAEDFHRLLLRYGIIVSLIGIGVWGGLLIWCHKKPQKQTIPPATTPEPPGNPVSIS